MNHSGKIALGGVLAALAVVVMCLGGMIPLATYICPILCMLLQSTVLQKCGGRVAWAWFFAVSILSLLLSPEKEGAAVFLFLGFYPMIKPWLDRRKGSLLWKLLFFNAVIFVLYGLLISVIGAAEIVSSFAEMGKWMAAAAAGMGNLTFFLVDILLSRMKGMLQ